MRLGTLIENGTRQPYVRLEDGPRVLTGHRGYGAERLAALARADLNDLVTSAATAPVCGGTPVAPIRPGKIVAIGLNYMDHVRETGMAAPTSPVVFTKFTSSVVPDGHTIRVNTALTRRVDWEVELAVVIGPSGRNIPAADACAHVFGYAVANDVSARDLQFQDGQWVRAKSLDGFCPLGPEIVTAEAIPDPQALGLRTVVNGEVVQDSTTAEMIFNIAELIAFCSRNFALDAGDVILTGTPWGCGEFMDPPRSLRHGDVVEVSVEDVGTLTNRVEMVASDD